MSALEETLIFGNSMLSSLCESCVLVGQLEVRNRKLQVKKKNHRQNKRGRERVEMIQVGRASRAHIYLFKKKCQWTYSGPSSSF